MDSLFTNQLLTLSSSDETIGSVDQQGNVTAHRLGTVTITAVTENGFTASCALTVKPIERILTLPAFLTEIDSEAFAGLTSAEAVRIPAGVTRIADDVFAGSNVIILAPENSWAAQWARDHGLPVIEE